MTHRTRKNPTNKPRAPRVDKRYFKPSKRTGDYKEKIKLTKEQSQEAKRRIAAGRRKEAKVSESLFPRQTEVLLPDRIRKEGLSA